MTTSPGAFGYTGKILSVNLTTGAIAERPLNPSIAKLYVGCVGIGGKILYDELSPSVSPFDSDNLLIFTTGPVTGTPGLAAGRHSVVTKSPLTGFFGDASAGGFWGAELKKAGFDAIIFKGKAPKPVFVWIRDGITEIRDASAYWGMSTRSSDKAIKEDVNDTKAWVANIGPAGENLVRYAAIANDNGERFAARCGVGAVMGSKRLKAIAVRGTRPVVVYNEQAIRTNLRELIRILNADETTKWTMRWGTSGSFETMMKLGDTPVKNWSLGDFQYAEQLSTPGGYAKIRKNQRTCFSCTIHCRPVVTVPEGKYKTEEKVEGPEYETLGALGSNLLIENPEAVAKLNDICNLHGLDTISTGGVLGWAMECYERGLITKTELNGIDLKFGDAEAAIKALDIIAYRQGFGDVLAEGTRRASKIVGHDSSTWAIEVKGLELPMHDPRAFQAMSLTYAFSAVGGDHMEGETMAIESLPPGVEPPFYPEYELSATDRLGTLDKAKIAFVMQNSYQAASALGYCLIASASSGTAYPIKYNLRFYEAATGLGMSANEFFAVGERIYNLKRAFNFKHGMQKSEDRLPQRLLQKPLPTGGSKGSTAQLETLRDEFCKIRGWDIETGKPSKQRLQHLHMDDVADDMWPKN